MKQNLAACGSSTQTVCVWYHLFREVCALAMLDHPKLIGTTENPIQVDEAFFGSRAKYKKGRRLRGDKSSPAEARARRKLLQELCEVV